VRERERERDRDGERKRRAERERESARVIADDLVVSSTPRRICRTSNSSTRIDTWVPGGLARRGASAGGSGWLKQRGGWKARGLEAGVNEENERAAVVFVRCGGGLARGDASGVFLW